MNVDEKFDLISRNVEEILQEDQLKKLLENKKEPIVYLGTAITGRPHIGYFAWVLKLSDFLKAGFKVKILLADLHGALDNCPWELLEKRYSYYVEVITGMFESVGADIKKIEFVKGSSFQMNKNYVHDLLKLSSFVSIHDSQKAASDVVKFGDNPKLSGLIYSLMQALDEVYLNADVQFGGRDQRKILVFARENLPKIGYEPRVEIINPLIPSLNQSGKMSASDPNTKIDLLDDKTVIQKKLNKAYCPEKEVNENGVLAFCKYVIFKKLENENKKFFVERPEKFGGNIEFLNYEELEKNFAEGKLHPMDLKLSLAKEIDLLLNPIRKKMENKKKLIEEAYPNK
ncbi:MAG: tyrosine--tRNA ligase [Candidatus ainarchaeum sp.]|nr:tyrosine--tRNA ligase [Candidatus ainarchaeum sp.]